MARRRRLPAGHDAVRGDGVGVTGFCMGGGLALVLAVPAARRGQGVRAVLRPHPVGRRPARLVEARRPPCGATTPRTTASSRRTKVAGAGGRRCGASARTSSSTSTPAPTTPSSTTPAPRSTTTESAEAWTTRGAGDRCAASCLRSRRRDRSTAGRRRALPRCSACGSAATSTASSTPTTGRPTLADRVAAEPVRPARRLADDARRLARRPRRRRPLDERRRRTGAAGCGPRSSACARPPRKLAGEPIALRRRGRGLLRRAARARSPRTVFGGGPPRASTRCCPARGPLAERYIAWREAQAVPADKLDAGHRLAGRGLPRAHRPRCSACPTASTSTSSS